MATAVYDAQMLDYPADIDVQMQSSTSDTWFHDEHVMDDGTSDFHEQEGSVEVEMEPYTEDVEFEMVDEALPYQLQDVEFVDVDVPDASGLHTPAETLHSTAGPTFTSADFTQPASHMGILYNGGSITSFDHTHEHEMQGESYTDDVPDIASNPHDMSYVAPSAEPMTFTPSGGDVDNTSGPSHHAESSTVPAVEVVESVPAVEVTPDHAESLAFHADITVLSGQSAEESGPSEDHPQEIDDSLHAVETDHPDLEHEPEHLYEQTSPGEQHHEVADGVQSEIGVLEPQSDEIDKNTSAGAYHAQTLDVPESVEEPEQRSVEANGEEEASVKDPHEISDGVYIDPPPPVFLSLPSHDDADVYLFNHPSDTDATTSRGADARERMLLLHELPTLYYEPLSTVFEALRGEEYVLTLLELDKVELVFDAFDLHLTVSEDNIYAREVTLHDLNVLHDSYNLNGPLRIRLQTVSPRFIQRYHWLQQQVSTLGLEDTIPPLQVGDQDATGHDRSGATAGVTDEDQLPNPEDGIVQDIVDEDGDEDHGSPKGEDTEETRPDELHNPEGAETDITEPQEVDATHYTEAFEHPETDESVPTKDDAEGHDEQEISDSTEVLEDPSKTEPVTSDTTATRTTIDAVATPHASELAPEEEVALTGNDPDEVSNESRDEVSGAIGDPDVEVAPDTDVLADDETSGDATGPNADGEEAQLTEDPFNAELESTLDDWEGDLTHDADADLDQSWEGDNEGEAEDEVDLEPHTQSGTTLSAKRSFDDVELEDNEFETERPESPGTKRLRTE